jgi:hypothetical protein
MYQFMYTVVGRRLNLTFVSLSNLAFGVMFYHLFKESLGVDRFVFALSLIVGNLLVVRQNFKFNDKLWSLVSLKLQLGTLLISLPNIVLSFLGLLLILFSFGRNLNRKKEFILNSGLAIWLIVFSLLISSWSPGFDIASIKTIVNEKLILIAFIFFFLIYGLWRCFYEVSLVEDSDTSHNPRLNYTTWVWIGIFNNFLILLFNELDVAREKSSIISGAGTVVFILLIALLFLKIENVKSIAKHISYTIIAQAATISFLIIDHSEIFSNWLIYTNGSLILLMAFFREGRVHGFLSNRKKIKIFAQVITLLLLFGAPFSPWFESNLVLLKHLKGTSTPFLYLSGLLFLGIRYRQNMILLINFIRANYLKVSKAS